MFFDPKSYWNPKSWPPAAYGTSASETPCSAGPAAVAASKDPMRYHHGRCHSCGIQYALNSDACRMICGGLPSFFGLGLEDGHVATFWLLLYLLQSWGTCYSPGVFMNPPFLAKAPPAEMRGCRRADCLDRHAAPNSMHSPKLKWNLKRSPTKRTAVL